MVFPGRLKENSCLSHRILMVEDSPTQAAQLRSLLETHGHEVIVAANGQEGVAAAHAHKPSLIVSDIVMPVMDGYEMCRVIKDDEALKDIPVILLTELSDVTDIIRGLQARVDCYVTKPCDEAYLLSRIEASLAAPVVPKSEEPPEAFEVELGGTIHVITASRQQMFSVLLSTYENAVQQYRELLETKREMEAFSGTLEKRVLEQTDDLWAEIAERKRAEEEREKLQAQLIGAKRMEAVGRLAAGIAHDFNNLLTSINGFAELMQSRMAADDPMRDWAGKILGSGQRAAYLVSQLLAFSRKQMIAPRVLNPNDIVTEMDQTLRQTIGDDIKLTVILAPDLWPVNLDPIQFKQVISDLAANARRGMPDGGRLTIETANVALGEEQVADHLEVTEGDYVLLAVSDTGGGMSQEAKEHIFEPFFVTSRDVADGIGLRMAAVYGMVKQNRGYIWVESEAGQGTTFKIYLPRATETG